jgi:hypothetical protein
MQLSTIDLQLLLYSSPEKLHTAQMPRQMVIHYHYNTLLALWHHVQAPVSAKNLMRSFE